MIAKISTHWIENRCKEELHFPSVYRASVQRIRVEVRNLYIHGLDQLRSAPVWRIYRFYVSRWCPLPQTPRRRTVFYCSGRRSIILPPLPLPLPYHFVSIIFLSGPHSHSSLLILQIRNAWKKLFMPFSHT